jgi:hypothetical protein
METGPQRQPQRAGVSPVAAGPWGFAIVLAIYIVAHALIG